MSSDALEKAVEVEPKWRARITIVETAYYQPIDDDAQEAGSRFTRECTSLDRPYVHPSVVVGGEWQPLDHGWLKQAPIIIIKNTEGRFSPVKLSQEQRDQLARRIVEVAYRGQDKGWLIRPGESLRLCPVDSREVVIRCRSEQARVTVYLYPE